MTETTTMVHVRVNGKIKTQATRALTAMGLSVSDAVRVFLTRIAADKQLPFDLKVPNVETRAAMSEARSMGKARFSTVDSLIRELDKNSRRYAGSVTAGFRLYKVVCQGLGPPDAFWSLQYEAAKGSNAAVGGTRCSPAARVAGPSVG